MPRMDAPSWAWGCGCEVRADSLTRALYATDGSIYEIAPRAVAFPRSAQEAASAIVAASEAGLSIIPRGAGTGLAGGALGDGLVIDFARHNARIDALDVERRTVRVGAGVILDQLNAFVRPYGLCFGPDVATSSRATLGGMIANNSSGARVPVYGTTADHLNSVEMVLADGRIVTVGPQHETLHEERAAVDGIVGRYAAAIGERMPTGLLKRWHGYALDRCLARPGDVTQILAGSEGTLAGIAAAELRLLPVPKETGVGVVFFASVAEAMEAAVELADLRPAAVEHLDRAAFDQTRGQLAFRRARSLLGLDERPCESMLMVEFLEEVSDKLAALERRDVGMRKLICADSVEQELVWAVRRAGLTLLTSRKGPAKPTAGIEDAAVRPERLAEYVAGLRGILGPLGVEASFYGHAASGLLHVRPVVDLHRSKGVSLFRHIADEVSALVREFGGSIAGEHGVGIARTEYLAAHLGPELVQASRQIKAVFDPRGRMNPGKIVGDGRYAIDRDLRQGAGREIALPFAPVVRFAAKDGSFVGNLEQCNGNGACRKLTPTMCPTYMATGEEVMSTRGRANVIRAALEGRFDGDGLRGPELDRALDYCLSCKACKTECPSNVDLALLKAEILHARQLRDGLRPADRLISEADMLGRLGCAAPGLANAVLRNRSVRGVMEWVAGIAARRPLPEFASERFDRWFRRREPRRGECRGRVILWDDTFVRYHEPHIGRAAVRVLEGLGFEVGLVEERACCGRPAFSTGRLDEAVRLGRHNVELLRREEEAVVFLEPSCYSMFVDDYRELGIEGADAVVRRCRLFEDFVAGALAENDRALPFTMDFRRIAVHEHCHTKALCDSSAAVRMFERVPNTSVRLLETGCCGMAGAYGAMAAKYDVSVKVAEPLVRLIAELPPGTLLAAAGTSCRQQIAHLTPVRALHPAEIAAGAMSERRGEKAGDDRAVVRGGDDGTEPGTGSSD